MKQIFARAILLLAITAGSLNTHAQKQNVGCVDAVMRQQIQDIKKHYTDQGFVVMRDAMINMSSMQPFPVIMELRRGMFYQIIFVGNPRSSKMRIDIHDGTEMKIDEKLVMRNRDQPNYITFPFIPERSDAFMFMLLQKLKNEDMCGSFTILQLKTDKREAAIIPYTGPAPTDPKK